MNITIPANGRVTLHGNGRFFTCLSSTTSFLLVVDNGEERTICGGQVIELSARCRTLKFRDISGNACAVEYELGDQRIDINPQVTAGNINISSVGGNKDASTYAKAHTTTTLPAGDTWIFSGLDGAKVRKQIVVSNNDATGVLEIRDSTHAICAYVQPKTSFTLVTNATLEVHNESGGDMNAAVLQTFYS